MSVYANKKKRAAAPSPPGEQVPLNAEADSQAELNEMQLAFRQRMKAEEERRRRATDSEFWFAVCFSSREEKEDFLRQFKLMRHGDKYLEGPVVKRILEKQMEPKG